MGVSSALWNGAPSQDDGGSMYATASLRGLSCVSSTIHHTSCAVEG
jgi:hypothetical protein